MYTPYCDICGKPLHETELLEQLVEEDVADPDFYYDEEDRYDL